MPLIVLQSMLGTLRAGAKRPAGSYFRVDIPARYSQRRPAVSDEPFDFPRIHAVKPHVGIEMFIVINWCVEGQELDRNAKFEVFIAVAIGDVGVVVSAVAELETGFDLMVAGDVSHLLGIDVAGRLILLLNTARHKSCPRSAVPRVTEIDLHRAVIDALRYSNARLIQVVVVEVVDREAGLNDHLGGWRVRPAPLHDVIHGPFVALLGGHGRIVRENGAAVENLVAFVLPVALVKGAELVFLIHLVGQAEAAAVDIPVLDTGSAVRIHRIAGLRVGGLVAAREIEPQLVLVDRTAQTSRRSP